MVPILLIFLASNFICDVSSSDSSEGNIQNFFHKRCEQYGPTSQVYENLKRNYNDFMTYSQEAYGLLPNNKQTFCDDRKKHMYSKVKKLVDELKWCLPAQEESFLPTLIKSVFYGFLNFLCRDQNVERIFNGQGGSCIEKIANSEASDNCLNKLFSTVHDNYAEKQDFCHNLMFTKKCFSSNLKQQCSNLDYLQSLNDELFQDVMKPCSGCSKYFLSLPIFFTVLLISKLL